ncbi:MAG: hypothetical protein E7630_03820 [Ruminococcaceae bacterium]|nr:hypothetical protein [Oscillospiraceae bacterium]
MAGSARSQVENGKRRRVNATRMEEIRWDPNGLFRENPYYLRLATRYQIIKYAIIVLALVFSVTMLTAFSGDITVENFQYLIKDLDLSGLATGTTFDTLLYNGGADSVFGIYRGELAVVSPGTVSLYKPSAALSLNKSNIYYSPKLLTSSKYFLVYDRGETSRSYSVFNSFAELKTETYDYPITGAALSDNGSYALVTRDDSYRGIVRMYNDSFRQIMEIKKDKYILSIDLSDDGKTLAIASVYDQSGDFVSEITTVQVGAEQADVVMTKEGILPLRVKFMKDRSIGVLYNDRTVIYHTDGTEKASYSYSAMPSVNAEIGDAYVCGVYNTSVIGNDKTAEIYDTEGHTVFSADLSGELIAIVPQGDRFCLLFEDKAVMIDVQKKTVKTITIEPNARAIVFSGETPIVCYSGKAIALDFEVDGD